MISYNNTRLVLPYGLPPSAGDMQKAYDLQEVRVIRRQEPLRPELPSGRRSSTVGGTRAVRHLVPRIRRGAGGESHITERGTPRQSRRMPNQFVPRAQQSA